MAGNSTKLTPRQKMINLMYIVLTAMLALNVSSDVLNGFRQVEEGLGRTTATAAVRNDALYQQLADFNEQNPEKGGMWYNESLQLRDRTTQLYNYIDSLKLIIVQKADGKDADVKNIQSQDDLEAASYVMLSPSMRHGGRLRESISAYRAYVSDLMPDSIKKATVEECLSTTINSRTEQINPIAWETTLFENMPVVAAVTILTKMQSDVLYVENLALNTLITNIDASDVRVNKLDAFVIPNSKNIMRGSKYSANIVLAAIDTTQVPNIYINGEQLPLDRNGLYEVFCGTTGVYDYTGYLEVPHGDGTTTRHDFASSYTVVEPTATVSATMMNVMYAGISNPVSISVPGIPNNAVQATMTNGTLTRNGDLWEALPATVGEDAIITVTATIDGNTQTVASTAFRVRRLPDPTPYIPYTDANGQEQHYKGGKPFSKGLLRGVSTLGAAIDDGLVNVSFSVQSFELVTFDQMGNALLEKSEGGSFSKRQSDAINRLSRGKRFYISNIKALGPDGVTRDLSPIEVIVN
ncbi:MAG: gliding motility protein GldM [Bacteroidaceae bacterium]|nr:gliding motility protein GldM [Bacteroidaceae bacterium]